MIKENHILLNDEMIWDSEKLTAQFVYEQAAMNYPKFFKMDVLCKWAMLGAEILLKKNEKWIYEGLDKTKIAVVLSTFHGCIDVDEKYLETTQTFPSPALFVYTLPNIMLGEICIKHGFKGEQLCTVSDSFDKETTGFWIEDLFKNRNTDACLYGWIDAVGDDVQLEMYWKIR